MIEFDDYREKYDFLTMRREDGILEVQMHTGGGPLQWSHHEHQELPMAFADIGADPATKVVILTGSGAEFIDTIGDLPARQADEVPATGWNSHDRLVWEGDRLLQSYLDVAVPVIAAVNGPARVHAELALLADMVVVSETSIFGDKAQFARDLVPGDGVHVLWPMLLGQNRGRFFLLAEQELTAQEALALGVVGEVVPEGDVLDAAWRHARRLATKSRLTLRYTRALLVRPFKKALLDELLLGLTLEGVARAAMRSEARREGRPAADSV